MSYHILHLLSPNLRVRLKLDQLHVTDTEKGTEHTVPLADVAVVVASSVDPPANRLRLCWPPAPINQPS